MNDDNFNQSYADWQEDNQQYIIEGWLEQFKTYDDIPEEDKIKYEETALEDYKENLDIQEVPADFIATLYEASR